VTSGQVVGGLPSDGGTLTVLSSSRRREAAVLLAYVAALALVLMRHEMWGDELQAWLLARDSASLADLWRNTRLEGHPLLWHILLWVVTRATTAPWVMQALHFLIASAAASVVVRFAPFRLWQRAALVFGYFLFFEYGVISRNYALSCLGIWTACAAALAGRGQSWGVAGIILAANSSPMGVVVAPALTIAVSAFMPDRTTRRRAALLVAAGIGLALVQLWPSGEYEHARAWVLRLEPPRLAYVLRGFAAVVPYLPRPDLHFWNASAIFGAPSRAEDLDPGRTVLAVAVLAVTAIGVTVLVRRRPALASAWLVGFGSLLAFSYVKFPGAVRHHGFLFVLLIGVLWLARGAAVTGRAATIVLSAAVFCGCAASAIAVRWDWQMPFSGLQQAASEIRTRDLDGLPLVGGTDFATYGVAAFLPGKRLFFPSRGEWGTFQKWDFARLRQNEMTPEEIVAGALSVDKGRGVVLLANAPLPTTRACALLFSVEPTIEAAEEVWAYRCARKR